MLDSFWTFLKDPATQTTLAWVGGGVAVVAAGLWTVITFFAKKDGMKAEHGSVVIGRDARNSPVSITSRDTGKR